MTYIKLCPYRRILPGVIFALLDARRSAPVIARARQEFLSLVTAIYKAFGIDWTKEYETPAGRPIKIANALDDSTASPIPELL
jgi:hypothetical protein